MDQQLNPLQLEIDYFMQKKNYWRFFTLQSELAAFLKEKKTFQLQQILFCLNYAKALVDVYGFKIF